MWKEQQQEHSGWLKDRLKLQFQELVQLAVPAVMMRLGILALGIVDTAFVGHYATKHLAWLNLAQQSVIMFALIVGLGLLMGILVYTSNAYGAGDYKECGRIWRRSIPYTLLVSAFILAIAWPAEYWLQLTGQTPEVSERSGDLIRILAIGMPGHLLFVNCTMFLEGVKKAGVGFVVMIGANVVNVVLDYMLIYGEFGAPEMGAEGSAWTTTAVRWFMAITIMVYVWRSKSMEKFGTRKPYAGKWSDWQDQRTLGYASGISLAAELTAFSSLVIFGGWLGTIPLAAQGVASQVTGLPLMMAVGIGVAGSVRVGMAFARKDRIDTRMAAMSAVILHVFLIGALAITVAVLAKPFMSIFTNDIAVIALLTPLAPIFALSMFFDGLQIIVSCMLRGLKEKWVPTILQAICFSCIMLPTCYILAFTYDMGLKGLMVGTLVGVSLAFAAQLGRFLYLTQKSKVSLLVNLK